MVEIDSFRCSEKHNTGAVVVSSLTLSYFRHMPDNMCDGIRMVAHAI